MALRPQIVDGLIIGGGPAGLTAALAFARTRTTAIVFDSGSYRNEGIQHMHTVPSRDHFDPYEFRRISREQITARYDSIWFENVKITQVNKKEVGNENYNGFEVKDHNGKTFQGRKVILATGCKDVFPDIPGYAENWPSHIYQCLACDGYEQRGTPIGILDCNSPMVSHLASMAIVFDPRVTIYSNGPISDAEPIQNALKISKALGVAVDQRKIKKLINNGPSHTDGVTIEFETGDPVTLGFIVHRPPTVNKAQDLIEQLDIETMSLDMGGHIKIMNPMFNETSVRGVFAAGDAMVMMKQVTIAMAEGLKAAVGAGFQIGEEKSEKILEMLND
ncbi:FAD/NAD(P)-binding domain-containing protein [Corynespora cassiicola Philippines]|uniref:FAD/NAD(P)-binding domain-containing protein n=1 Tax=Corynespora cassiicola Philippines TaxID=1448308 RepID=A0A2T2P6H4_CORCC|nr:FAD/NAD(P)-binding domain-containing protein [Corynespora cassiicola Philippines]